MQLDVFSKPASLFAVEFVCVHVLFYVTRHLYSSIKVVPVGMSKGVKKLMQEKFPNMSKFEDISELLLK